MKKMLYIGCSGLARSGKNLYGDIALNILKYNGYNPMTFALADELKYDCEDFLRDVCDVDAWTEDTKIKESFRPFLVWLGCFQRSRKPDYWIKRLEDTIEQKLKCNVYIVTDIRFKNEADWIHSKEGHLIHISKYLKTSSDGGRTWERKFKSPPNKEEELNDPIVKAISDFKIEWEDLSHNDTVKFDRNDLINNSYLKEQVFNSLKAYPDFKDIKMF